MAESRRRSLSLDRRLLIAALVVCLIGLADASYLTYNHYAHSTVQCFFGSSCETVQKSAYSKLAGVPVALLGLIGYVAILVALAIRGDLGRAGAFCVALIGFGFSAYLTYRELFTIHAICQWCVGSAVCMTILVVLTAVRFLRGEPARG